MAQNLLRGGALECATEAGVFALSEPHQIAARRRFFSRDAAENRRRDRSQRKWSRALPLFYQVIEDGRPAAQRNGLTGKSTVRRGVEDGHSDGAYSSTNNVTSSRTRPPSPKRSSAAKSDSCSSPAPCRAWSLRNTRKRSESKNTPSEFSVSVSPSL